MSDLIERDIAIDAVKRLSLGETDATRFAMRIGDYLERMPSAQLDLSEYSEKLWRAAYERGKKEAQPDIVRCKDCKYHDENWRRVSPMWLPCMDMRMGSNWYCGYAERREDG